MKGNPVVDRIWARVMPIPESGCWIWMGATNARGYGRISINGKLTLVHRLMYEAGKGPIPAGLVTDHLCRVPGCCNPDHLEAVTSRENVLRGHSPVATNARREVCKNGHPFVMAGKYRECRVCEISFQRARRAKKSAMGVS